MSAFYKIDKANRLVMTTASGTITMADAIAHRQKLAADPDFDPSFSQLLDVSHISKIGLNAEDIRVLAQGSLFSSNSRRAILVSSDAAFGFARMFELLREAAGETGIEVFRDLDAALDWVLVRSTSA